MANDTRERILATAGELFTEQGYEATSLRQISDRLGFTKAALYYHFQSKDEILLALLQPADEIIRELLDRLESADSIEAWGVALEWVIDAMLGHLDFFKLIVHNRAAVEALVDSLESLRDHGQMHERVEAAVLRASDRLGDRVRMVAALGAVTGFDDWAPELLTASPAEEIRTELSLAVRDILGLPAAVPHTVP